MMTEEEARHARQGLAVTVCCSCGTALALNYEGKVGREKDRLYARLCACGRTLEVRLQVFGADVFRRTA